MKFSKDLWNFIRFIKFSKVLWKFQNIYEIFKRNENVKHYEIFIAKDMTDILRKSVMRYIFIVLSRKVSISLPNLCEYELLAPGQENSRKHDENDQLGLRVIASFGIRFSHNACPIQLNFRKFLGIGFIIFSWKPLKSFFGNLGKLFHFLI